MKTITLVLLGKSPLQPIIQPLKLRSRLFQPETWSLRSSEKRMRQAKAWVLEWALLALPFHSKQNQRIYHWTTKMTKSFVLRLDSWIEGHLLMQKIKNLLAYLKIIDLKAPLIIFHLMLKEKTRQNKENS